mmetsp:Transcript_32158/g.46845  ORF Transcript_32158/g.46845 Transcript_32158/m.46845 type:complete len:169 (-) Transcript_32158:495-1001(-)
MCVSSQTGIQSKFRPASWIPGIRNVHSEEVEWAFPTSISKEQAMDQVSTAATSFDNFIIRLADKESGRIIIDTLTKAKWMDQIIIKFEEDIVNGGVIKAKLECCATGFLPLVVPLAPAFNAILCFIPFGDNGNCGRTLRLLEKKTSELLNGKIESTTTRYSLSNPRKP